MKIIRIILILLFITFGFLTTGDLVASANNDLEGEIVDLGEDADYYDIASDAKNTIHVLWIDNNVVYYGQIVGEAIVNKEKVSAIAYIATNKFRPRLSVKSDGTEVHVAYCPKDIDPTEVKHAYRDSGGAWHVKTAYNATGGRKVQYPSCAVDGDGVVHFTFIRYHLSANTIPVIYVRRDTSGNYKEMEPLSPKTLKNIWPDIYTDKKGNVHAVWSVDKESIHYRYADAGGDLSTSPTINVPRVKSKNKQPDVFVDEEDNIHLTFLSYEQPGMQIHLAHTYASMTDFTFTAQTYPSIDLIKMEGHYHDDPCVAAQTPELVYVAWAQETTANLINKVRLSVYKDGEWIKHDLDNTAQLKKASSPSIALNGYGVYVVWRGNEKTLKMYYEIIGYGTEITSPLDGEKVCGDLIKITASPDPEITDFVEFYVDGALIDTLTAEPFETTWDSTNASLGTHTIKMIIYQYDGQVFEDEITIEKNCPPTIDITNIFAGDCVAGTVDVEVVVSDDKNEVDRVEYYVDGKLQDTADTFPYSFAWNTDSLSFKNHTLKAVVYDKSNLNSEKSITVKHWAIYKPAELTGKMEIIRSLFFKKYIAKINWQQDSRNGYVAAYRIYTIVDDERTLLAQVDGATFDFVQQDIPAGQSEFVYAISSVDGAGNESVGAYIKLIKPAL